jgi:hypothetical protein
MKKLLFLLTLLIITLLSYSQSRSISVTTKKIVFNRDGGICKCCGSSLSLEYDHIVPFSCGGSSTPSNIQLLCQKCNRSKSNGCYCKIHNKKVGYNCCDDLANMNIHKSTLGTVVQCLGTTKKGSRCKNKTTNENGRCYLHQ